MLVLSAAGLRGVRAGGPVRDISDAGAIVQISVQLTADGFAIRRDDCVPALDGGPIHDDCRITGHGLSGLHLHPDDLSAA